jgi:hypothetical protein
VGFKPCFVFRGPEFEQKEEYKKFANLLLDILSTLLPCLPVAAALRFPLLFPRRVRALFFFGSRLPLFILRPLSLTRPYISTEER